MADLVSALNNLGVPYDVVAVNTISDIALAGHQVPALRFTDRDALLVRSDLRPPVVSPLRHSFPHLRCVTSLHATGG